MVQQDPPIPPPADREAAPGDSTGTTVEAYLRGDAETVKQIGRWIESEVRKCYPRLTGEVEDLRQAVHGHLLISLRLGRFAGRSSLRSYVTGIAHHAAIDRLRQIYRERALTEALPGEEAIAPANPYRSAEAAEKGRLVHQVVQALPAACQELWRLVFLEKKPYTEIAVQLEIPPGTVKSRMWHCRQKAETAFRRLLRLREEPTGH